MSESALAPSLFPILAAIPRMRDADAPLVERLSEVLFLTMEHLDPTEDWGQSWEQLTEHQRDFYRHCVVAVLREAER